MENNKENLGPELIKAMMAFHQQAGGLVGYDSFNPFFTSKYASLGAIIDLINKHASSFGLTWMQFPVSEPGQIGVKTIVAHESGQSISESMTIPFNEIVRKVDKSGTITETTRNVQQEAGSVITYLRRYGLAAAFGLYADEDLDGNHPDQIVTNKPAVAAKAPAVAEPEVPIDPDFPDQGSYVAPEAALPSPKAVSQPSKSGAAMYVKPGPSLKTTPPASAEHVRMIVPTVPEGEQFGYALRETLDAMNFTRPATEKQIPFLEMLMVKLIPDETIRHEVRWDILGINNFKGDPGLSHPRIAAFLKWLSPIAVETGELTSTGKRRVNYTFPPEVLDAIAMACEPYVTI